MSTYYKLQVALQVEVLRSDVAELSLDELFAKYREQLVDALYAEGDDAEFLRPSVQVVAPTVEGGTL